MESHSKRTGQHSNNSDAEMPNGTRKHLEETAPSFVPRWFVTLIWSVKQIGLPSVVTLVILGGGAYGLRWIATEVVTPLRDAHAAYLTDTSKSYGAQTELMREIKESEKDQAGVLKEVEQALRQGADSIEHGGQRIDTIIETQRQVQIPAAQEHQKQLDRLTLKMESFIEELRRIQGTAGPMTTRPQGGE